MSIVEYLGNTKIFKGYEHAMRALICFYLQDFWNLEDSFTVPKKHNDELHHHFCSVLTFESEERKKRGE